MDESRALAREKGVDCAEGDGEDIALQSTAQRLSFPVT